MLPHAGQTATCICGAVSGRTEWVPRSRSIEDLRPPVYSHTSVTRTALAPTNCLVAQRPLQGTLSALIYLIDNDLLRLCVSYCVGCVFARVLRALSILL